MNSVPYLITLTTEHRFGSQIFASKSAGRKHPIYFHRHISYLKVIFVFLLLEFF